MGITYFTPPNVNMYIKRIYVCICTWDIGLRILNFETSQVDPNSGDVLSENSGFWLSLNYGGFAQNID